MLLFVCLVFFFLWRIIGAGLFTPADRYDVPNLIGKNYEEVADDQELLGRFTLVQGETVADESDPGTIIDQEPKAEDQVGEGVTQITVTVSGGPEIIVMIDLTNMEYQEAYQTLREMGLKPKVPTYEYDEEIQENHIISTPLEGAVLTPGTEVELVVSRGPEKHSFAMPDLTGMTLEIAQSTIGPIIWETAEWKRSTMTRCPRARWSASTPPRARRSPRAPPSTSRSVWAPTRTQPEPEPEPTRSPGT